MGSLVSVVSHFDNEAKAREPKVLVLHSVDSNELLIGLNLDLFTLVVPITGGVFGDFTLFVTPELDFVDTVKTGIGRDVLYRTPISNENYQFTIRKRHLAILHSKVWRRESVLELALGLGHTVLIRCELNRAEPCILLVVHLLEDFFCRPLKINLFVR